MTGGRVGRSAALTALARRSAIFLGSVVVASVVVFAFMAVLPGDPAQVALGVNAGVDLSGRPVLGLRLTLVAMLVAAAVLEATPLLLSLIGAGLEDAPLYAFRMAS